MDKDETKKTSNKNAFDDNLNKEPQQASAPSDNTSVTEKTQESWETDIDTELLQGESLVETELKAANDALQSHKEQQEEETKNINDVHETTDLDKTTDNNNDDKVLDESAQNSNSKKSDSPPKDIHQEKTDEIAPLIDTQAQNATAEKNLLKKNKSSAKRGSWVVLATTASWRICYKHKIKLICSLAVMLILTLFFTIGFTQLLKHNSEDNHIVYFDTKTVGDKLVIAKTSPTASYDGKQNMKHLDNSAPLIIQKITEEYQKASDHNSSSYFVFCSKQSDYIPYFFDIAESEWRFFQWFNLGNWWLDHWHNKGPLEALAKDFFDDKSNYKSIYAYSYDATDKSTESNNAIANINTIVTAMGQNSQDAKKKQNNVDLSGFQFNIMQITKKVLTGQTLSTDESVVNSKWFNDLSVGPIIIKIVGSTSADVQIHLCNDLLNLNQLIAL